MLSYQHIYHAGNLADVHKHALLSWMLEYLTAKDKPLSYIETHAGRGLYDLGSDAALKTGEAEKGITLIEARFPKDHPYRRRLAETRARFGPMAYPGSPLIAALSLREIDTVQLCEMHPAEAQALRENMLPWGAIVHQTEGMAKALAICPPMPRRGLLLIDPSWEVKADYDTIPTTMGHIARKWNVGIIALWYPILAGGAHGPMLRALSDRFADGFRHEVRFPPVREGHRMEGSGMFVINPPWGLADEGKDLTDIFRRL